MAKVVVNRYEPTDPRLGRHVWHDDRSRNFPLTAARLPTKPIWWDRQGPVFDQADLGCCTACAALGLMMTEPYATGFPYTIADCHDFYHAETVLDGITGVWPPHDTGSSSLAAMKTLKARGLIQGYRHAFSPTVAVAALTAGPIAVGTVWLESMFEPKNGRIVVDTRSPIAGGHEYVINGWDPATQRVYMTNSWGPQWGDGHGGVEIAFGDFSWLLRQRGDAVQPTVAASST